MRAAGQHNRPGQMQHDRTRDGSLSDQHHGLHPIEQFGSESVKNNPHNTTTNDIDRKVGSSSKDSKRLVATGPEMLANRGTDCARLHSLSVHAQTTGSDRVGRDPLTRTRCEQNHYRRTLQTNETRQAPTQQPTYSNILEPHHA